jgi:hypothetical protein
MFGLLGGGFPAMPGFGGDMVFEETYRCYSVAVAGRSELEQGDKSASRHGTAPLPPQDHGPPLRRSCRAEPHRRVRAPFVAMQSSCLRPPWTF